MITLGNQDEARKRAERELKEAKAARDAIGRQQHTQQVGRDHKAAKDRVRDLESRQRAR